MHGYAEAVVYQYLNQQKPGVVIDAETEEMISKTLKVSHREYLGMVRRFKTKNKRYKEGAPEYRPGAKASGPKKAADVMAAAMKNNTVQMPKGMAKDLQALPVAATNVAYNGMRDNNRNCTRDDAMRYHHGNAMQSLSGKKRAREQAFAGNRSQRRRKDLP